MGDAFDPGGNDVTEKRLDLISIQDLKIQNNIESSNHVAIESNPFAGEASPTPIYDDDFRGHATSQHDDDESDDYTKSCWPLLYERAAPR